MNPSADFWSNAILDRLIFVRVRKTNYLKVYFNQKLVMGISKRWPIYRFYMVWMMEIGLVVRRQKEGMVGLGRGRGERNILLNENHHERTRLIYNSNYANKNLTQTKWRSVH